MHIAMHIFFFLYHLKSSVCLTLLLSKKRYKKAVSLLQITLFSIFSQFLCETCQRVAPWSELKAFLAVTFLVFKMDEKDTNR